jgi:hypothetical protein
MTEREYTRRIDELEREKFGLPYAWIKEHGASRETWADSAVEADKATAPRRREILDELRQLRAERKAIKEAARRARESAAATKKAERENKRAAITSECQICEGQFCTKGGRMVHHGYQRPGDGAIHGDCYGVGHIPFPAVDALCQWRECLETWIGHLETAILEVYERDLIHFMRLGTLRTFKRAEVSAAEWSILVRDFEAKLKYDLKQHQADLSRVERRIKLAESLRREAK